MILPYRTDAPVYHWPVSTVGLIAVNLAVFMATSSGAIGAETLATLVLQFGDGLHPLQWLTSSFIHGDIFHVLGNMMFLWVFGLVVEGKVGWLRFLGIYLGMGVVECALEQVAFLGLEGGGYGASAIVFGLLTITLYWAPENEAEVFYWIGWRAGTFTARLRTLCGIYFALEVLFAARDVMIGSPVGSSLFHLMGAVVGIVPAVLFLKQGWVDCEGWDLFSLRRKRAGEAAGSGAWRRRLAA